MQKTSKNTFLIGIILLYFFAFGVCAYATSDRPKIQVVKFANESVVRSVAPYID